MQEDTARLEAPPPQSQVAPPQSRQACALARVRAHATDARASAVDARTRQRDRIQGQGPRGGLSQPHARATSHGIRVTASESAGASELEAAAVAPAIARAVSESPRRALSQALWRFRAQALASAPLQARAARTPPGPARWALLLVRGRTPSRTRRTRTRSRRAACQPECPGEQCTRPGGPGSGEATRTDASALQLEVARCQELDMEGGCPSTREGPGPHGFPSRRSRMPSPARAESRPGGPAGPLPGRSAAGRAEERDLPVGQPRPRAPLPRRRRRKRLAAALGDGRESVVPIPLPGHTAESARTPSRVCTDLAPVLTAGLTGELTLAARPEVTSLGPGPL